MKKIIILFVFIGISKTTNAQDFSNLKAIPLRTAVECKNAESKVVECANYLLSKPVSEDLSSLNCAEFIMAWMSNTPEFTFALGGEVFNSISSNTSLAAVYLASQSSVAIEKRPKNNEPEFVYEYTKKFLDYCENPKNEVKLTSKLKKLIKAKNENNLKEILAK